jgi:predicted DNA-binding protein
MSKTITLRLSDEEFERFSEAAAAVKRPVSNLIRYLAEKKLEEDVFADQIEMEEIRTNKRLVADLAEGSADARQMKGKFVDV